MVTELGQFGAGIRAVHDPRPGDPDRWDWTGELSDRPGPTRPPALPGACWEA